MLRQGYYIVSAGGAGIGLAICREIAAQGGTAVALDPFNAPAETGAGILHYPCDVSDSGQVEALVAELSSGPVPIEGLVNCAGIAGPTGLIDSISAEDWERVLGINVISAAILIKNVSSVMKKQRRGAIVSISSACTRNGFPQRAPYVVSKAALEMLSETMAMELGPWGIRSNVVVPGIVEGVRIEAVAQAQADTRGISFDEAIAEFTARTSLKAMVSGEDIAKSVRFLLSDEARHVSGQKLAVCGNFEGYSSEMVAPFARV
ncbi:SDR family NAD(P)-dependent oxidoreductase [Rhodobacter sp. 24-YEA-8]|uniref:SDR family NAD(P)-dependent oxidoreductase n=1 Tax=Rhodobacter sp. 24-YEA-8 TaxID=1884310 RepID=UPI000899CF6E|nr:SDR family oxidoreductase [Rhodobacter sp. 24-YEA-8]SED70552.1 NAD(P)-dependent dehydrogenase, short-chain alcohol dehydrogenase family [Rhodobacter sp. 24-YEA-8]